MELKGLSRNLKLKVTGVFLNPNLMVDTYLLGEMVINWISTRTIYSHSSIVTNKENTKTTYWVGSVFPAKRCNQFAVSDETHTHTHIIFRLLWSLNRLASTGVAENGKVFVDLSCAGKRRTVQHETLTTGNVTWSSISSCRWVGGNTSVMLSGSRLQMYGARTMYGS